MGRVCGGGKVECVGGGEGSAMCVGGSGMCVWGREGDVVWWGGGSGPCVGGKKDVRGGRANPSFIHFRLPY